MNIAEVQKIIREEIIHKKKTLQKLSTDMGISYATMRNIMQGRVHNLNAPTIERIKHYLDLKK